MIGRIVARRALIGLLVFVGLLTAPGTRAAQWQPAQGPLSTRWTGDVSPKNALPDYPRPQLSRQDWLNLNGLWDYAIRPAAEPKPASFDGKILVPYPVESALSGVMKKVGEANRLWYRRTFEVPRGWRSQRTLLHFGAVDWDATVFVNGRAIGAHQGGYDGFSVDITRGADAERSAGTRRVGVGSDGHGRAAARQAGESSRPGSGTRPSRASGRRCGWSPCLRRAIDALMLVPDIDAGELRVTATVPGATAGPARQSHRDRRQPSDCGGRGSPRRDVPAAPEDLRALVAGVAHALRPASLPDERGQARRSRVVVLRHAQVVALQGRVGHHRACA